MSQRSLKIFLVIVVLGLLTIFIQYPITLGWLLGCLISFITFKLTERFCDIALSMQNPSGFFGHFALNYGIWAIGLIIAAMYPNIFNVIACACGMMSIKLAIIIDNIITLKTNKS